MCWRTSFACVTTSNPATRAVPPVGFSSPARMRRIVDLPQPEGPSSDRNDRLVVPRLVASRAFTDLRPMVKVLLNPWMLSPVAAAG